MVTYAMVTSYLNYCNMFHIGLPLKTSQKLQLVQNTLRFTLISLALGLFPGMVQAAGYYL